ncbi:MAG: DUF3080 family protein [Gammaproteobacteria bacterium]|nr:DUF3080 family protein [Gammaproteobacteria bacterium]
MMWALCAAWLALLGGCHDTRPLRTEMDDYAERVQRLLQQDAPAIELVQSRYPSKVQLRVEIASVAIDWSDFFATLDCPQLQQLISERNSATGRQMDAMTSLLYELDFHFLVEQECRAGAALSSTTWRDALRQKKQQQPQAKWNATWAGEYWQLAFSLSSAQAQHQPVSAPKVIAAMAQIRQISQHYHPRQRADLIAAFKTIEMNKGALGELVLDLRYTEALLNHMNQQLAQAQATVCRSQKPTQQALFLKNVLWKFFINQAQRTLQQELQALHQLEQEVALQRQQFAGVWPRQNDYLALFMEPTLAQRIEQLSKQHVAKWQALAKSCNMSMTS